jgi:hypothetical protein
MTAVLLRRGAAHITPLVLLLLLVGCGSSDMTSPSIVIPGGSFIPDFTFQWRNTADSTNVYTFITDKTGTTSGNFTNSSGETLSGVFSTLTGTFNNRNVTFTVARASGAVTATGGFVGTGTDTIQVQFSTSSTIVTLVRFKQ